MPGRLRAMMDRAGFQATDRRRVRQAGIIAAGALYALDYAGKQLVETHTLASQFAGGWRVSTASPSTKKNFESDIVRFTLADGSWGRLRRKPPGTRRLRAALRRLQDACSLLFGHLGRGCRSGVRQPSPKHLLRALRSKPVSVAVMSSPGDDLRAFIDASPSPFHAVAEMVRRLSEGGFTQLSEQERWTLQPGDQRYVIRDGGSLIAFGWVPSRSPIPGSSASAHTPTPPPTRCARIMTSSATATAWWASNPTAACSPTPGWTASSPSPDGSPWAAVCRARQAGNHDAAAAVIGHPPRRLGTRRTDPRSAASAGPDSGSEPSRRCWNSWAPPQRSAGIWCWPILSRRRSPGRTGSPRRGWTISAPATAPFTRCSIPRPRRTPSSSSPMTMRKWAPPRQKVLAVPSCRTRWSAWSPRRETPTRRPTTKPSRGPGSSAPT